MSHIDKILDKLEHVNQTGVSSYRAKCPAHEGHSNNSLSIAEGESGRILVHCFSGCGGADVMAAIGLSLSDLYEDGALRDWYNSIGAPSKHEKAAAAYDQTILDLARADRASGRRQSAEDMKREREALLRIKRRAKGEV